MKEGVSHESRAANIKRASDFAEVTPDYGLPDCGLYNYIVELWREVGEADINGSSMSKLSWQTIKAWLDVTGRVISSTDVEIIMAMSAAYCSEYYAAQDGSRLSPLVKIDDDQRKVVADSLKQLFGG